MNPRTKIFIIFLVHCINFDYQMSVEKTLIATSITLSTNAHICDFACSLSPGEFVLHSIDCKKKGREDLSTMMFANPSFLSSTDKEMVCKHQKDQSMCPSVQVFADNKSECKYQRFEQNTKSYSDKMYFSMCAKLLEKQGLKIQAKSENVIEILIPGNTKTLRLEYTSISDEPLKNMKLYQNPNLLVWSGGFKEEYNVKKHGETISYDMICEYLLENGCQIPSVYWNQYMLIQELNQIAHIVREQMALSRFR